MSSKNDRHFFYYEVKNNCSKDLPFLYSESFVGSSLPSSYAVAPFHVVKLWSRLQRLEPASLTTGRTSDVAILFSGERGTIIKLQTGARLEQVTEAFVILEGAQKKTIPAKILGTYIYFVRNDELDEPGVYKIRALAKVGDLEYRGDHSIIRVFGTHLTSLGRTQNLRFSFSLG